MLKLKSLASLALVVLAAAGLPACSSAPRGPSAEVRATCIPPEAAPTVPVELLYRRCRDVVLREEPEIHVPLAEVPVLEWGKR